jgi:hypothetical protein
LFQIFFAVRIVMVEMNGMTRKEWKAICWWIVEENLSTEKQYKDFCLVNGDKCSMPDTEELRLMTKRYGEGVDRTMKTVTWHVVWKAASQGRKKTVKDGAGMVGNISLCHKVGAA